MGYSEILRILEPLDEGRDRGDRITYSLLWLHAKRHHDVESIAAHREAQLHKKLRNALKGGARPPIGSR